MKGLSILTELKCILKHHPIDYNRIFNNGACYCKCGYSVGFPKSTIK